MSAGKLLQDKGDLATEPLPEPDDLLSALPLELQLHVANAVGERCDRAALALASPRLLGLAACRELPSYQGLEMRLAIDEQLLRRYVRRSNATPEGCKRRAGVAGLQISCSGRSRPRWSRWSGVPSELGCAKFTWRYYAAARAQLQIRVTVSDKTGERWYLLRSGSTLGALLRHGEPRGPRAGTVHHYKGEEGAERVVRNEEPDGRVAHFEGERGAERVVRVETPDGGVDHYEGEGGAERLVRAWSPPAAKGVRRGPGEMVHCEGEQGAERIVRAEQPCSNHVLHFEGEAGAERRVRHEWPDGGVDHYEGEGGAEVLVRHEQPDTLGLAFVQHFDHGERKRSAAMQLLRLELPYGGVIHFEGEMGASGRYWL